MLDKVNILIHLKEVLNEFLKEMKPESILFYGWQFSTAKWKEVHLEDVLGSLEYDIRHLTNQNFQNIIEKKSYYRRFYLLVIK